MNPIWLVHIFQMGWWKTTNESSILRSIFPMAIEVDSCAFALLFPTVSRAMREQAHDAKMKGVQSHSWKYSFLTQKSPSSQRFGWWVGDGYDGWVMRCGGIQVKDPVRKGYFLSFQRILKQNVQQTVGRWSGSCQHLIPLTKHQWKKCFWEYFLQLNPSNGQRIVGASVHLIADPVLLQPYLQELMPLLEEGMEFSMGGMDLP